MKKYRNLSKTLLITGLLLIMPAWAKGQSQKAFIKKYLTELPSIKAINVPTRYRMTAIYTNRDLYGRFMGKTRVTGEYTKGLPGDTAVWNNVYISSSQIFDEPFPEGTKKDYMENFRYVSSSNMMQESAFKNFPATPENIFARNLVWDMLTFETFATRYYDSLKLNEPFIIPDIRGQFDMADIGKYSHKKIILCWNGVTVMNGELCAVIDFNAIDNLIELNMAQIKTKGTEQYWGSIQLSLKTKTITNAMMYSGAMQEIEVPGMKDKFLVKTIRELEVNKIR